MRVFFTVNITNLSNYLIYIMKLQVFTILWFVLILGLRFVATNQVSCIVGWLTGFCMVHVGDFGTDSSTWSTFLMFLTLLLTLLVSYK